MDIVHAKWHHHIVGRNLDAFEAPKYRGFRSGTVAAKHEQVFSSDREITSYRMMTEGQVFNLRIVVGKAPDGKSFMRMIRVKFEKSDNNSPTDGMVLLGDPLNREFMSVGGMMIIAAPGDDISSEQKALEVIWVIVNYLRQCKVMDHGCTVDLSAYYRELSSGRLTELMTFYEAEGHASACALASEHAIWRVADLNFETSLGIDNPTETAACPNRASNPRSLIHGTIWDNGSSKMERAIRDAVISEVLPRDFTSGICPGVSVDAFILIRKICEVFLDGPPWMEVFHEKRLIKPLLTPVVSRNLVKYEGFYDDGDPFDDLELCPVDHVSSATSVRMELLKTHIGEFWVSWRYNDRTGLAVEPPDFSASVLAEKLVAFVLSIKYGVRTWGRSIRSNG